MLVNKNKWYLILKILGLLLLLYFPIFGHLGTLPIRLWDESRLAINAFEMLQNKDYLVTYFDNVPDLFNTKPPLLIWFQVFWMKLLGPTELAVRLPSAIAALFTCLGILVFSIKYLKNFAFGFIAVIVLITSQGYIDHHAARTGDYESLLTFFMVLASLFFYLFIETKNNKLLYLCFLNLTLAVLTKSIAGLFFIPAFILYSFYTKSVLSILKNKHFYISLLSFLAIIVGFYYLRELTDSGYWEAVKSNEFGGRFLEESNGHVHDFWFHFNNLKSIQFSEWYLLVPCGIAIGLLSKNKELKKITVFSTLIVAITLLILSTSKTKLIWYTVPLFPFLAILVTIFIHTIYSYLKKLKGIKELLNFNIIPLIFLFLIIALPYQNILTKTFRPIENKNEEQFYAISYYLQDVIDGKINMDNYSIVYNGYKAHVDFYLKVLKSNGEIISTKALTELKPGDRVISAEKEIKEYIEKNYNFEKQVHSEHITKYQIK